MGPQRRKYSFLRRKEILKKYINNELLQNCLNENSNMIFKNDSDKCRYLAGKLGLQPNDKNIRLIKHKLKKVQEPPVFVEDSPVLRGGEQDASLSISSLEAQEPVFDEDSPEQIEEDMHASLNVTIPHLKDGSPIKFYGEGEENDPPQVNQEGLAAVAGSSTNKRGAQDGDAGSEAGAKRAKPYELYDCYLHDLYEQVKSLVVAKPDDKENVNEDESEDPSASPMIWIKSWVDYSDKYGLAYQLSDDSIGVLFNDFTDIMLLPDGENIYYIERGGQEHYHRLSEYPQTLNKKVALLRHCRNYMNDHLVKDEATMHPREGDELARIPILKTYFRTRSAIIMYLTNGTLQINFFEDHTKIILCPLMGAVTYIDKDGSFRTFRLEMLMKYGCSVDLGNRIRFALNMIHIIQELMLTT